MQEKNVMPSNNITIGHEWSEIEIKAQDFTQFVQMERKGTCLWNDFLFYSVYHLLISNH